MDTPRCFLMTFIVIVPTCESAIRLVKHLLITYNFYYPKLQRLNHHLNEWYDFVNYLGVKPYTFLRKSSAFIYAGVVHADSSTRHHHGETCNVSINHIIPHLNPWFVKLWHSTISNSKWAISHLNYNSLYLVQYNEKNYPFNIKILYRFTLAIL